MVSLECFDFQEFGDYLLKEGVHEDVVSAIVSNRICSETFLDLTESDLKELAPTIGDRIRLRNIIEEGRKNRSMENPALPSGGPEIESLPAEASITSAVPSNSQQSSCSTSATGTSQAEWHLNFVIPELRTFSQFVTEAVNTGVVTARARREIVQVLRTYITAHTVYPSSEQYKMVCAKLVTKFPNLKDTKGSKYGSWKLALRTAFKNFRRSYFKDKGSKKSSPPSPKHRRLYNGDEPDITEEEYEDAIKQLQEEYRNRGQGKKGGKQSLVKQLMEKTKARRHQWIRTEKPLVSEITNKFPHLNLSRWMRREFKAIVSFENDSASMIEGWLEWSEKVIEFSRLESSTRPFLRKLLGDLEKSDQFPYPCDNRDAICLELLTRLLYPRGLGKNVVFIKKVESCDVDLDGEISDISQSEPFLLVTDIPGTDSSQVFVCCERRIFLESKSMSDSLLDLIATYFVFDIAYPKYINAILIFLQHFVMDLPDKQPVPSTTSKLTGNLQKLT